ncbi:MAG: thioredoxin family protein [Acidiferrobacterales bacterium]|nr:thioredoxin family protein [Acidiferrobacterales bacterium]
MHGVVRTFVAVLILSLAVVFQLQAEVRDPEEYFFHQSFGDLPEEVEIAKEEGQTSILVMFELNDCPWCERMKEMILNQSEVQDYFRKHFRVLMMNVEGDNLIVDFDGEEILEKDFALKHNRIRATPVFLFLDLEGSRIARYTGAAKNIEEFMLLGEYVTDGHFETTNFVRFKRARLKSSSN